MQGLVIGSLQLCLDTCSIFTSVSAELATGTQNLASHALVNTGNPFLSLKMNFF